MNVLEKIVAGLTHGDTGEFFVRMCIEPGSTPDGYALSKHFQCNDKWYEVTEVLVCDPVANKAPSPAGYVYWDFKVRAVEISPFWQKRFNGEVV